MALEGPMEVLSHPWYCNLISITQSTQVENNLTSEERCNNTEMKY